MKDKRRDGGNFNVLLGERTAVFHHQDISKYPFEGTGSASGNLRYGCVWSHWGNSNWLGTDVHLHYFDEGTWDISGISPDLIAAQAISSLHL